MAAPKLTVAVTGPTGDIGLAALQALDSSPQVGEGDRHGAAAVRPGRARPLGQGRLPARRRPRSPVGRRARRAAPTSSSTSPSSSSATPARRSGSTPRAAATSSRRRSRRAPSGSSTRRRSPPTASTPTTRSRSPRTCPRAAARASTTPPTRPSSRASSTTASPAPDTEAYVFRPCIVAGAGATTLIETTVRMLPVYGQLRLVRRALDQVPFLGPVLPDPGHGVPARPHARRRGRAPLPPSRGRRARPLQPRRPGVDEHRPDGTGLRLVVGARSPAPRSSR